MRYIHQLPRWPDFHWDHARLLPLLAQARHQQGMLLGGMQALGFRFQQQSSLENLATDVVKSSAVEGTVFDPASVRSSIARRMGLPPEKPGASGRDIEGAVEMILDATQHYDRPLTEDRLLGWQAALFPAGRSGVRRIAVGQWRTPEMDPMQVVSGPISQEQIRRKHIHFEAPSAARIPGEVAAFLKWFESPGETDPVLRAGVAHLWFVTIHPFEDGNGRISRAVADMALARAEGSPIASTACPLRSSRRSRTITMPWRRPKRGTSTSRTGWSGSSVASRGRFPALQVHSIALWQRPHAGSGSTRCSSPTNVSER